MECKGCWVVAYWPFCVFQSRWRWRRLLPRDPGLSAPFALPLCYPGSIPARCLWQWRGCMALPCQPNAVRYRWFFCCLHLPRVFQTVSGKSLVFILHSVKQLHTVASIYFVLFWIWLVYCRACNENLGPSHIHLFAFLGKGSRGWVISSLVLSRSWRRVHSVPQCCWMQRRWVCLTCQFCRDNPKMFAFMRSSARNNTSVFQCCSWSLVGCWRLWSLVCWSCRNI